MVESDLTGDLSDGLTLLFIRGFYSAGPDNDFMDIPCSFFLKDVAYDSYFVDVSPIGTDDSRADADAIVAPGHKIALTREGEGENIPVQ